MRRGPRLWTARFGLGSWARRCVRAAGHLMIDRLGGCQPIDSVCRRQEAAATVASRFATLALCALGRCRGLRGRRSPLAHRLGCRRILRQKGVTVQEKVNFWSRVDLDLKRPLDRASCQSDHVKG